MAIIWRLQHEVHPQCAPAPDFLAFDGDQMIGRLFRLTRRRKAVCWYWTVTSTAGGPYLEPLTGVEQEQGAAAQALIGAYKHMMRSPVREQA